MAFLPKDLTCTCATNSSYQNFINKNITAYQYLIVYLFHVGSHVRFAQDTVLEPEHVQVKAADGKAPNPEAHIGLLSVHHTYHAEIPVTHSLSSKVAALTPEGNASIKVLGVSATEKIAKPAKGGGKYSTIVTVEVKTTKDGPLQEKIQVIKEGSPKHMVEVLITAKVLQSHQGNPLLKDGVHMISHDRDEDEVPEWPGKAVPSDIEVDDKPEGEADGNNGEDIEEKISAEDEL